MKSRVGDVRTAVEATADLMPGVVSLPHGWGHSRDGARLTVAARDPGVSINDLTDDAYLDDLSGNAALNGVVVTVESLPTSTEATSPADADGTADADATVRVGTGGEGGAVG